MNALDSTAKVPMSWSWWSMEMSSTVLMALLEMTFTVQATMKNFTQRPSSIWNQITLITSLTCETPASYKPFVGAIALIHGKVAPNHSHGEIALLPVKGYHHVSVKASSASNPRPQPCFR